MENALFATLDPTVRKAQTPDGIGYTLSDTVGFVRSLPTQLVEAFRSTLEEVADADVILHVVDEAQAPASRARRAAGAKEVMVCFPEAEDFRMGFRAWLASLFNARSLFVRQRCSGVFCSVFKSESRASKTPLSQCFVGLLTIKPIAK